MIKDVWVIALAIIVMMYLAWGNVHDDRKNKKIKQ